MSSPIDVPVSSPRPWLAVVLSLFLGALGLLYAGNAPLAILFFVLTLACRIIAFATSGAVELAAGILELVLWVAGTVLAWRIAAKAPAGARPWYARWYSLTGAVLAVLLCVYGSRMFLLEGFLAPSSAMLPTAGRGDRLLVRKLGYGHLGVGNTTVAHLAPSTLLRPGELAMFEHPLDPRQTYFARVAGVGGDVLVLRGGHLFVNGRDTRIAELGDYRPAGASAQDADYVRMREQLGGIRFETLVQKGGSLAAITPADYPMRDRCAYSAAEIRCTVPPGHYFMLGDHRDFSQDSRYFGFVRAAQVIGRVVSIFPRRGCNTASY